ncbi:DUF3558 family protein [Actinocrispum sp. NPDC049592]|uniref:DUF3558 family protein n=1 Tax=Actinocrispum sp. NPDC049592 TaxID=3154835 RepID=UPI00342C5486
MKRTRSTIVAGACALAAVLTACSQTTPGSPQASSGDTAGKPPTSSSSTTNPSTGSPAVSDPCALLPKSDAATLGWDSLEPHKVDSKTSFCLLHGTNADIAMLIGVLPKTISSMGGTSVDIGTKHKAAKVAAKSQPGIPAGGCAVALELPDQTSVLAVGTSRSGKPDDTACPTVNQVIKVIDAKLP